MFCWISAVFARMAFFPVPKRALILPSDGLGINYCTKAERVKNLFLADSWAADLAFYIKMTQTNLENQQYLFPRLSYLPHTLS